MIKNNLTHVKKSIDLTLNLLDAVNSEEEYRWLQEELAHFFNKIEDVRRIEGGEITAELRIEFLLAQQDVLLQPF